MWKWLKRLQAKLMVTLAAEGLKVGRSGGGENCWETHRMKARDGEGLTQAVAKRRERRQL